MLDPFSQFGNLVTKARYKQELHLGASRTNALCKLKAVEVGHDNITHHKVYCAIVFLVRAKCVSTIDRRKHRKPVAFERPVQEGSKVVVVFDQEDGARTLTAGRKGESLVR